jgi:hypothetical protein
MTDKVQKIREEVERLKSQLLRGACSSQIAMETRCKEEAYNEVLAILDTVQEEPVSEDLEKAAQEYVTKEGYLAGLHYNSMVRSFKAGAEWHASHNTKLPDNLLLAARKASIDMCDIDDKYLDEYPYHPIAEQKFIEGAKWQKENLWKPADGDSLPEYDREVIVLTQPYPLEGSEFAVSFAHRPDPKGWDGKSIATGKVEHLTPKTYGKGGWNIPDVIFWLYVELPKEMGL